MLTLLCLYTDSFDFNFIDILSHRLTNQRIRDISVDVLY